MDWPKRNWEVITVHDQLRISGPFWTHRGAMMRYNRLRKHCERHDYSIRPAVRRVR